MPTTDLRGHRVPTGTDFATRETLLELSKSINAIKTVATLGEADLYKTDLTDAGLAPSPTQPAFVWRSDAQQIHANIGGDWLSLTDPNTIIIGGQSYSPTSGRVGPFNAATWTASGSGYYTTVSPSMPFTPPPGWAFIFTFYSEGSGQSMWVGRASGSATSSPAVNLWKFASTASTNIYLVWQLVRI